MDVRCRANRACMASLSPAAMRLTRMTSDEVSPAPAAIADTAAAAEFGGSGRIRPIQRVEHGKFPFDSRPDLQSCVRGCGSCFFFLKRTEPVISREVRPRFSGIRNPNGGVGASIAASRDGMTNESLGLAPMTMRSVSIRKAKPKLTRGVVVR